MGSSVERWQFDASDVERFARRLQENLATLRSLLGRPGFGEGATSLGAELELSIIDGRGRVLPLNRTLLEEATDPQIQLELDRFNLEYNLPPVPAKGTPFTGLERGLARAIELLNRAAAAHGGRVVPIGIVPTLRHEDLAPSAMTQLPRYRALAEGIRKRRGRPFEIEIEGEERLSLQSREVTFEGANTSLQIHLRVAPRDFAAHFNAAQLASAVALTIAANSPTFLGRKLWDETRVALFQQSVDVRGGDTPGWLPPGRVSFGQGWVREGAWELFAEAVALHPPLIPQTGHEELLLPDDGRLPRLAELRLHQGTVWNWNRAIYDPGAGGHLRIELRSLPSGPTPLDMAASAAFLVGLTVGLARDVDRLLPGIPFRYARRNFYEAARYGLDARLLWTGEGPPSPAEIDAPSLIAMLLPTAAEGLASLGVTDPEIGRMLGVIRARVESGITGARWQRRMLDRLEPGRSRDEALLRVLEAYLREAASAAPVHEWSERA